MMITTQPNLIRATTLVPGLIVFGSIKDDPKFTTDSYATKVN